MTDLEINELCRAFVRGATIETIAEVQGISEGEVKAILSDNAATVLEFKNIMHRVRLGKKVRNVYKTLEEGL